MSIPEQSGDSFDFCVLFRVYFTGKGAHLHTISAMTTEQKRAACEQVKLKLLLYKCRKSVNGLPHIRISADDVDIVSS